MDLTSESPPEQAVNLDKTMDLGEGVGEAIDASEQKEQARVWEGPERTVSDASMGSKKKKKSKQTQRAK